MNFILNFTRSLASRNLASVTVTARVRFAAALVALTFGGFGVVSTAHAQDAPPATSEQFTPPVQRERKLSLGVWGGYNLNQNVADFPEFSFAPIFSPRTGAGAPPTLPANFKGSSVGGAAFGVLGEYRVTPELGVGLRVGYTPQAATFTTSLAYPVGRADGTLGDGRSAYTLTTNVNVLTVEPLASYNVWDALNVYIGARLGFILSSSFKQAETLEAPSDGTFSNGTRTRNQYDKTDGITDIQTVQVSAIAGISYDIALTPRFVVAPEVFYALGFMPVVKNVSWNVSALRAGLALKYKF